MGGGQRSGLAREPVCCYYKFFSSSLERIAQLQWTNLGNHIYLYLFTRGNYSLTGGPLTRLEAPFLLPFKGSNMAETQRRAFRCSMNQQDTLTAHNQDIFHKGFCTKACARRRLCAARLRGIAFKSRAVMKTCRHGSAAEDQKDHLLSRRVAELKISHEYIKWIKGGV